MTNKLTKNDSMRTEIKNFDVLVATFESFLNQVSAHDFYFKTWAEYYNYNGTANVFYAWRQWAKMYKPSLWIVNAFIWSETNKGYDYWYTMHFMWKKNIIDNLKK